MPSNPGPLLILTSFIAFCTSTGVMPLLDRGLLGCKLPQLDDSGTIEETDFGLAVGPT